MTKFAGPEDASVAEINALREMSKLAKLYNQQARIAHDASVYVSDWKAKKADETRITGVTVIEDPVLQECVNFEASLAEPAQAVAPPPEFSAIASRIDAFVNGADEVPQA